MTRPSRGISDIQEKARGKTNMTKLKAGMFPLKKKDTIKAKVTKRAPTPDLAQLGAMRGAAPAMKKGGSACRGMYKGGSVDGITKKGKTRGKII
jgi:hypothetical protein